jgi:hypothetical protein
MQQGQVERVIYVGVDTHRDVNVAVVIDAGGAKVAHAVFSTNR